MERVKNTYRFMPAFTPYTWVPYENGIQVPGISVSFQAEPYRWPLVAQFKDGSQVVADDVDQLSQLLEIKIKGT